MEGRLARRGSQIVDASSSVTLIESAGQNIVVDTGSPRDASLIAGLFNEAGVSRNCVQVVVNTHLHIDHIGCNGLFERARFVAHRLEDPPADTQRIERPIELAPGVLVVPTPGHTSGSISVFVSGERKWAICGDAIPTRENYAKHLPPFMNVNPKLALDSMDAILGWADEVVPGHGGPFKVIGKKYVA